MTQPAPDGNIRAARRALNDAIHHIVGRTTTLITHDNGRTQHVWGDSLYTQLRDGLITPTADGRNRQAGSQPPVWVDAADLLTEIDKTVRTWQPDPGIFDGDLTREPTPETVRRLHHIEDRTWRPQDTDHIEHLTAQLLTWADRIRQLLDPPMRATIPAPCPACQTTTVYRRDSAGDTVRQPALQIGAHGCVCLSCRTTWAPSLYTHLARVLGFDLPEGVLE